MGCTIRGGACTRGAGRWICGGRLGTVTRGAWRTGRSTRGTGRGAAMRGGACTRGGI
ncbi:MAG: hypothetical protein RLO54_44960 [Sandaracinaceae bacterium]